MWQTCYTECVNRPPDVADDPALHRALWEALRERSATLAEKCRGSIAACEAARRPPEAMLTELHEWLADHEATIAGCDRVLTNW